MNTIRLIVIALPVTLLLACGGGGGGGTSTPSTGGGGGSTPQVLPTALITDEAAARNLITGSTAPTSTAIQAQQTFQSRITDADRLLASDGWLVTPGIPGATVSTGGGIMIDDFTIEVTLEEVQMGVADWLDLTRFNSRYAPVMDHAGVMLAQYSAAGRNGGDIYEYQSYGGWLTNSAFSVDMLTINGGSDDEYSLLVGISYGEESGSRPTGTGGLGRWTGLMVGVNTGNILQGDASVEIDFGDTGGARITSIAFQNIVNINTGDSVDEMTWRQIDVGTDGTFSSTTGGDIDGAFYGDGHTEVGGTFNRNNIIGAFGGTRQ